MKQTLIERIATKRLQLGGGKSPLAVSKCATQIDISPSSLHSILKYGELAVGDTIRPKLEAWLKGEKP